MSNSITAGQEVTYQGEPYVVRSIDGNVLALEYHTGGFFRFVHSSSVTACSPSAIQTAASLDAPAAGQGEGTGSPAEGFWGNELEAFNEAFDAMVDSQAGGIAASPFTCPDCGGPSADGTVCVWCDAEYALDRGLGVEDAA